MQKNDQNGVRAAFAHHLYANPYKPWLCPILALALWPGINPIAGNGGPLFPGEKQQVRFNKKIAIFKKMHASEIRQMGFDPGNLGVHSLWKGSLTYLSSGSTAGPSSSSIYNRAGWSQGCILVTYLLFERAADCFGGRILTGPDLSVYSFAALPPRFQATNTSDYAATNEFIYQVYPTSAHTHTNFLYASITPMSRMFGILS
jgi:hypothetical protein